MRRRTFLTTCSLAGLSFIGASKREDGTSADAPDAIPDIFPQPPPVRRLITAPLDANADWHDVTFITSAQGLINRDEPRVYLLQDDNDAFWRDYYHETYRLEIASVDDPLILLDEFKGSFDGFVTYDPDMLDSANVATTFGAIERLIPVAPSHADRLRGLGLKERANWVGRWKNRYEAYRWALRHIWPKSDPHLLGIACTDVPLWPSDTTFLRDYIVAHDMFTFDLSACMRDREDRKLLTRILDRVEIPGCLMGWRCARCGEHELVALAAEHGHSVLCAAGVRNLSIHAAIPRPEQPFKQTHIAATEVREVERKVYISFMATDGDALPSMMTLQSGRFSDPEHGIIPVAHGYLPIAYDLMPGIARCNYERKLDNDYFVTPSSGALYTYPYLHPDPRSYLRYSRHYMNRCDLRTAYMINWIDEFWWQEIEFPDFLPMLREELPECFGFFRGMGESPFERQYIGGGAPYIMCGEGIHRNSDVLAEIGQFIEANSIRPLFIFCMSNHTMRHGKIKEAMDALAGKGCEIVRLDEFVHMVNKAHDQGVIPSDDFYPDKSQLRILLKKEGEERWPGLRERIRAHADRARAGESSFAEIADDPMLTAIRAYSSTPPADIVAFDAVGDAMELVRTALNRRGIYVNNKAKGIEDFMKTFGDSVETSVVSDIWELWTNWNRRSIRYARARDLAEGLEKMVSTFP